MTTKQMSSEVFSLRPRWGWLMLIGILMIVVGFVALAMVPAATIGTTIVLGWILLASGIVEAIHAFGVRRWSGVFLHLAGAILGILTGLLIVTHPVAGAVALTLLFASFLTVIGLFRLTAAASLKYPGWGWAAFDAIISLGLGLVLWFDWPWSGVWFIGLSVGLSLLLRGWSYVMFAMGIHSSLSAVDVPQSA